MVFGLLHPRRSGSHRGFLFPERGLRVPRFNFDGGDVRGLQGMFGSDVVMIGLGLLLVLFQFPVQPSYRCFNSEETASKIDQD